MPKMICFFEILHKYAKCSLKEIESELDLKLVYELGKSNKEKYAYFEYLNEPLRNHNLSIRFEFQKKNYRKMIYGLKYIDSNNTDSNTKAIEKTVKSKFEKEIKDSNGYPKWLCFTDNVETYRNWIRKGNGVPESI